MGKGKEFYVLFLNIISFLCVFETYAFTNNCLYYSIVANAKSEVNLLYKESVSQLDIQNQEEVSKNMKYFLKSVADIMFNLLFKIRCMYEIDSPLYQKEYPFVSCISSL